MRWREVINRSAQLGPAGFAEVLHHNPRFPGLLVKQTTQADVHVFRNSLPRLVLRQIANSLAAICFTTWLGNAVKGQNIATFDRATTWKSKCLFHA